MREGVGAIADLSDTGTVTYTLMRDTHPAGNYNISRRGPWSAAAYEIRPWSKKITDHSE